MSLQNIITSSWNQLPENKYHKPWGYYGVGSDIKWCGTWHGGKRCLLCKHYAEYEEWTTEWNWYYLVRWFNYSYWDMRHVSGQIYSPWRKTGRRWPYGSWGREQKPKRYNTPGLRDNELYSLFKKGCRAKKGKKCKCMNIAQRGNWYCPQCFKIIEALADVFGCSDHDVMLMDRNFLKEEYLILMLSGTFNK
jgi:hypothetical protein